MKRSHLRSVLAILLLSATAHAQSQPVQWRVEDGGNGHWYGRLDATMGFLAASAVAQSKGAHLATCGSAEEWLRIAAAASAPPLDEPYFWIGLYQDQAAPGYSEPAGAWRWVDGTTTFFSAWNGGEPNNTLEIEHFAHGFFSAGAALWNDCPGSNTFVSAIEWSADCNGDGIVDYGQILLGQLLDANGNGIPDSCEQPPPDCNQDGIDDAGQCRDGTLADFNSNNIPDCCEAGTPCETGIYPLQWRLADGGNGHWYKSKLAGAGVSWHQARFAANEAGGHLATVISEAEYQLIWDLAANQGLWTGRSGPWLGGYQDRQSPSFSEPGGGWRWVTEEPWFPRWGPGEPNNAGDEDYLHFISWNCGNPIPSRHLNDFPENGFEPDPCAPVPVGYIIEWSADCNGDGIVDYGQILGGQLLDENGNGVPDSCEADPCPADTNGNGIVNHVDLAAVLSSWGTDGQSEGDADTNDDGTVDGLDLTCVLGAWGPCTG